MSSSISHRSTRSSWRSSMDGTLVSHTGSSSMANASEKESSSLSSKSRRSSTWKRVTTLYAPSPQQTVAEDDTLDLWDNDDSDFQRQIAIEAVDPLKTSASDLAAMSRSDSVPNIPTSNPLLAAATNGLPYKLAGSPMMPASQSFSSYQLANDLHAPRPSSASALCQFSSPSLSANSSDRNSAFTIPSPGLCLDDTGNRKRFSNVKLPHDALEVIRAQHLSSPLLHVESEDGKVHRPTIDQEERPAVEILQEPWNIWSAKQRPSLPEKERLQMEALDELVRSQLRRTSDKRSNSQMGHEAESYPGTLRTHASLHNLGLGVDSTMAIPSSQKVSKHDKKTSSSKSGRQGCAIDPWSEMTPFGMIVERPAHVDREKATKRSSASSRSSKSPRDALFAEQTNGSNQPSKLQNRKKSGCSTDDDGEAQARRRKANRASVVEHLTYDQARLLSAGASLRTSYDSMQPPPRPVRPDEDMLSHRLTTSSSLGRASHNQTSKPSLTNDLLLPRSKSESHGMAAPVSINNNIDDGESYPHSNLAPQSLHPLVDSNIVQPSRRTSSPTRTKAARFGKISKLLRSKNTIGLLKKAQTPEDDEDFTRMAEDPFAHRTVVPFRTLSPLPKPKDESDQRATKPATPPTSSTNVNSLTARSPYAQSTSSRQRSYDDDNGALHGLRNRSASSLSISNAKRPTFGLHLQPDAAAAFDSIPLPDTPERSLSRSSSFRKSFASPSVAEERYDATFDGSVDKRRSYVDDAHEVNSALSHDWTAASLPDDLPADIDECDDLLVNGVDAISLTTNREQAATAIGIDEVEFLADGGDDDEEPPPPPPPDVLHVQTVPSHFPVVSSSNVNASHVSLSASPTSYAKHHQQQQQRHPRSSDSSLESYIFPTRAESLADDVRNSWHAADANEADYKQPVPSVSPRTSIIAPHLRRPSSSSSFI